MTQPENEKPAETAENPVVSMKTSMGEIKVELFASQAPATVSNFLSYADNGFYDGTIFHRVIENFMIQGGGFTRDMRQKPTRPPIANEAQAALPNKRGTIAMARTPDPHSATSQFFINVEDNASLNHRNSSQSGYGYCVFGEVTEGMDVVDAIRQVETHTVAGHADVPVEPVVIEKVARVERDE